MFLLQLNSDHRYLDAPIGKFILRELMKKILLKSHFTLSLKSL